MMGAIFDSSGQGWPLVFAPIMENWFYPNPSNGAGTELSVPLSRTALDGAVSRNYLFRFIKYAMAHSGNCPLIWDSFIFRELNSQLHAFGDKSSLTPNSSRERVWILWRMSLPFIQTYSIVNSIHSCRRPARPEGLYPDPFPAEESKAFVASLTSRRLVNALSCNCEGLSRKIHTRMHKHRQTRYHHHGAQPLISSPSCFPGTLNPASSLKRECRGLRLWKYISFWLTVGWGPVKILNLNELADSGPAA